MTCVQPGEPDFRFPSLVLLVEDNVVIAMNTEELLQDLGVANVVTAGSVAEAMMHIDARHFDLALLDLRLRDDEDSLPVAERLRGEGVPIVFATGTGEETVLPEDYRTVPRLKKPYGFDDLKTVIRIP